ncbi:DUF4350 domain-containing protein [Bacteroides sp. OttesenSCG-928-D19]|nr:DUF4350 domain-containing protein [Bacteroides sp. OttesenSCG-928-D19]
MKWYILFIIALLAVLIALEYTLPKQFVWTPTFSRYDDQPFGAKIFDDVVEASCPDGYSVVNQSLYQLAQDSLTQKAVLVVDEDLPLTKVDADAVLDMVNRGNKVMLVATSFGYSLPDTLDFQTSYGHYNFNLFKRYVADAMLRDTIQWNPDSVYHSRGYAVYPHLCITCFIKKDDKATVLAYKEDELVIAVDDDEKEVRKGQSRLALSYKIGAGELCLVSTPLLFTNYGMLDGYNSEYIFRLLSRMNGLPLVRTEAYGNIKKEPQTPLRYFLSQPPLRWAIYLTMVVLCLFMIFTAKRQQRVIPVVKKPENKSIEFIELIATLYFQKKDYADLVRKKYFYFAETLRRNIQVDLDDGSSDETHARRISSKTTIEPDEVLQLIRSLRRVIEDKNAFVNEALMRKYIDRINKIINLL